MNRWMHWILNKQKSSGFKTGIIIASGLLFLLTILILIFPAFTLEANEETDASLASEEVLVLTLEESSEEEITEDSSTEEEEDPSLSSDETSVEISCEDILAVYSIRSDELTEESTVETLSVEETETLEELKDFDEDLEANYELVELTLDQPGESSLTLEITPLEERKICLITQQDDRVEQIEPETKDAHIFRFQPGEGRVFVLFEHIKDEGTHSDSNRQNHFTDEKDGVLGEYTDQTFDEVGGVYLDEFFMKNYNYMVFGNLYIENQCDLGVIVQGDMISNGGLKNFASTAYAVGPSYIGGTVSAPGAAIRREGALDTRENIGLYLDTSNDPLYKNDYTDKSNYKLAGAWQTANQVGGTYFVDEGFFDWDHAREFIDYASKTFLESSTETIVVDNMASWGHHSPWETVLTVKAGTTVTARFEDSKNSKTNLCYGFIDIVDTAENTENLPTIINITGTSSKKYEQVFQLRYVDGVQVRADNYASFGQNLILHFPDAKEINVNNRLVFGHVLAPNATMKLEGGDHFGCLVGKTISSSSTGHPGVTGHVVESPQTVTIEALKRVDDAVPTDEQIFSFALEQYYEENEKYGIEAGFHSIGRNLENDGETIRTDLTNLSRLQTEYWFRITEAASSDSSYICDQTPYYARIVLKGTDFEDPVYYREKMASDPDDQAVQISGLTLVPIDNEEGLPVFYNKTMKGVPMLPETGGIGQEPYLVAGFLVMTFGAAAVLYRVFR